MKKTMSLLLTLACLMQLFGITASASGLCTPSGIGYDEIGGALDEYVKKYEAGLASCEVAVFDPSGMITAKYYGFSDIENHFPADENTVYEWASCSKLLIWVAVMQQVERGTIDLNADIREYLPDGFLTKLQYEDEKITMVNLMNHNAGFQESYYENQTCGENELYDNLEAALKACECYQAYHVGEYTAYSNYGSSLAAFIVECVTGMDYREYVQENIFLPLHMEHTAIDPHTADNLSVREKREELKCYSRYEDPKYNEDLGVSRSWVQLYPAGSAIGTLEDFAKFGIAVASPEGGLFEERSTWEEMVAPTSFFGDSGIAKNCHGFWTTECKVQVLGHAGNTDCTSMLAFDPVSKLGVVIMTNEPRETIFCYGIPNLLFGEITDRPEYSGGYIADDRDISGIYLAQRTIDRGAVYFYKYCGNIFPIHKNSEGSYDLAFGSFTIEPDNRLYSIADRQYILERNGMKQFLYYSGEGKLEMMSQDIISGKAETAKMLFLCLVLILGAISVIVLAVKAIIVPVRKIRKKQGHFNKQITVTQTIYAANLIVFLTMLNITVSNVYWFTALSSALALCLGMLALFCGIALVIRTATGKMTVRSMLHQLIWSTISVAYFIFIVVFQVYKFWTL